MAKIKNKLKPLDAPLFGCWKALFLSFYSKRLYIDVAKRWKGMGLKYLLLLIALWSIPFSVHVVMDFNENLNLQFITPLSDLPLFYIQNGEVHFDKPMPYIIKSKNDEVVLIVDTTGKVNDFSPKYPALTVLITKNKVAFRMPPMKFGLLSGSENNTNKPMFQIFTKEDNMVFDGKKIIHDDGVTELKYAADLIIYPLVFAMFFGLFMVFFSVFGFLGQLFARIFFSFSITVKQGCKLLIVSSTPMMLLLLLLLAFNGTFPGYGFMLLAVLAVYFSMAVWALKSESNQVARS